MPCACFSVLVCNDQYTYLLLDRTAEMHNTEPERPASAPDPRTARRTLLTTSASDCLDSRDPHHLKAALKQTLGSQSSIKAASRHGDLTTRHLSADSQGFGRACSSASQDSESEYLPFEAAVMPPAKYAGVAMCLRRFCTCASPFQNQYTEVAARLALSLSGTASSCAAASCPTFEEAYQVVYSCSIMLFFYILARCGGDARNLPASAPTPEPMFNLLWLYYPSHNNQPLNFCSIWYCAPCTQCILQWFKCTPLHVRTLYQPLGV